MSLETALHDPAARFYAQLVLALALVAGLVLAFLTYALGRPMTSVWAKYRGWLVILPLAAVAIGLGRFTTIVFFSGVAVAAFKEFAAATGLYRDWGYTILVYVAIFAQGLIAWIDDPYTGALGWFGLFRTLPVYVIGAIMMVPIVRNRARGQLQSMSLAILGFVYVVWMFGHVIFLADSDRPYAYLLYLLVAVELNDLAGFTFGKLFGRHPLRGEISANRTWEGCLGALAFSMALPWVLGFTLPHFGPTQKMLAGVIVSIGGQLGDLSIGVVKRDVGVKDLGAVLPGHHGVLDRIDSLIYTAPLFLHMVNWYYGLYGVR